MNTYIYTHKYIYIYHIHVNIYILNPSNQYNLDICSSGSAVDGGSSPPPEIIQPPPQSLVITCRNECKNPQTTQGHQAPGPQAPNILLQPFLGIAKEPIYEYDVCVSTPLCSDVCYHFDVFYHFDMTEHVRPTPCFF